MVKFDPEKLKELREQKGVSVAEMAEKLGVSVQQAHRLEKGERRLTVDMLLAFCNELDVNVGHIFSQPAEVPITGIINELYEVLACPPNSPHMVRVPALVPDNTCCYSLARKRPYLENIRAIGFLLLTSRWYSR